MSRTANSSRIYTLLPPAAPIPSSQAPFIVGSICEGDPDSLNRPDVSASQAPKSLGGLPARPRIQRKSRK